MPRASTVRQTEAKAEATSGNAYSIKFFSSGKPANLNATLLVGIVLLLVSFGIVMVLSSSSVEQFASGKDSLNKFLRQLGFAAIGVLSMFLVARVRLEICTGRLAWAVLAFSFVSQLLIFTPLGVEFQGNRAWLNLGFITVQPSEFAKVALVMWVGYMVSCKGEQLRNFWHVFLPIGIPVMALLTLPLLGKDLGTVMVLGLLVLGALWFGGVRKTFCIILAVAAAIATAIFVLTSGNRMARVQEFLSDDCDYEDLCWQTTHALFALARGGIFGVGLGNSTAKWSWLPEADNDYIFAIVGEEFGLLGAAGVIFLFFALAVVLIRIWRETKHTAGRALVGGVFSWFIYQAFVNIAVAIGLVPVLGVPLPLMSSGGSALVTSLFAIGLVLSVCRYNAAQQLSTQVKDVRQ